MPTNGFVSFRFGHNSLSINAKCPKMNTHFPLIVGDCQTGLSVSPLLSSPPSLALSDALTGSAQIEMRPERDLPSGLPGPALSQFYIFLTPLLFFAAPHNGMKVYKLSNSSRRQSVPASCHTPSARCQSIFEVFQSCHMIYKWLN